MVKSTVSPSGWLTVIGERNRTFGRPPAYAPLVRALAYDRESLFGRPQHDVGIGFTFRGACFVHEDRHRAQELVESLAAGDAGAGLTRADALLASGLLKREEALLYPSGAATRFNRLRPL